MARPRFHALVTAPLAWAVYRRWGAAAAAGMVAGGIFVDGDHLVDWAWTSARGKKTHFIVPLHGWEYVAGVAVLSALAARARIKADRLPDSVVRPVLGPQGTGIGWQAALGVGLAAGLLVHYVQDTLTNRPRHPGVYSLLYRLRNGFRREITGWADEPSFHSWSHQPWYTWL